MVPGLIAPSWPAPDWVKAFSSTREQGYSSAPFAHLNMGNHVGDLPENVALNRGLLNKYLGQELRFHWLEQVHGTQVADLNSRVVCESVCNTADGSMTQQLHQVCVVMTADCLPVLFTDQQGTCVAAAHAGWRGLCAGVLETTVNIMPCLNDQVMAWLGPAIGPTAFQVGSEVKEAFCSQNIAAESCFIEDATQAGKWLADLYSLARLRLNQIGVEAIYGGEVCTYTDSDRYFSYRRDGTTGRMATGIWLAPQTTSF